MHLITDLRGLLLYQVAGLLAAEEQMMQAMPSLIRKAQHRLLKNALNHHHDLTGEQIKRLQQVQQLIMEEGDTDQPFSIQNNKGIQGLLEELMDMLEHKPDDDIVDASLIAGIQKIEHYEITAYGTAHSYSNQLNLHKVGLLLSGDLKRGV